MKANRRYAYPLNARGNPGAPRHAPPLGVTVIVYQQFKQRAPRFLSEQERLSLVDYLADNPKAGVEFAGTGGSASPGLAQLWREEWQQVRCRLLLLKCKAATSSLERV